MTAKTKTARTAPAANAAKGEADKARACKFPRAILVALIRADGAAEEAGLSALQAGITERCSPDLYMDCAREVGKAVPLASAKVRASEINAAHGVAKVWGAKPAAEIIAAGCKLPGHKVRNALQALRVAKDCAKEGDMPSAHAKRMAKFNAAWKAAQVKADALKASRADALKAGKAGASTEGEPTGAEGNVFPKGGKVASIAEARATLATLRANAQAVQKVLADLPAAAFSSKAARTFLLEGQDTLIDLFSDALKPAAD